MDIAIIEASTADHFDQVRVLFRNYGAYLSGNPCGGASICVEGLDREIASLPGPYASPGGVILLAQVDCTAVGCVALRPASIRLQTKNAERNCEIKRLWTAGSFRNLGLGRKLMESAIAWARKADYQAMYLDTVPAAMPAANKLYGTLGFEQITRYNDNPVPDLAFFCLKLESQSEFLAIRPVKSGRKDVQNPPARGQHPD